MDPPTIVKTFKHNPSTTQPIFTTRVLEQQQQTHPLHFRSFSQANKSSSDIPFSSYFQKPKQNVDVDTELSIFDAQKYFCGENNNNNNNNNNNDNNKGNPKLSSHDQVLPRLSSVSSSGDGYNGRNFRTRSFHATPTASSEASWNSQTGLLVNPPGSVRVSMKSLDGSSKKQIGSGKKWIFGRKCCCTGRKSVQVKVATSSGLGSGSVSGSDNHSTLDKSSVGARNDTIRSDNSHRAKALSISSMSQRSYPITGSDIVAEKSSFQAAAAVADPPRQQRISASGRSFVDGAGGFSFPILKNPTQAVRPGPKGMITKNIVSPLEEDPPRDSLEVFQPPVENIPAVALTAGRQHHHFNPESPMARLETTDDDLGSDASSDLFELESFSTQTTSYPMYRRRDSLDEAPTFNARRLASQYGRRSLDEPPTPSVAATECYAPSEVSIDWSVTTAEGFDRASVSNFSISASEAAGAAFFRHRPQEEAGGGEGGRRKGSGGGGGGGGMLLMSCRQEKAVSVGPQPVKCLPAAEGGGGGTVYGMHVGGRPPRVGKTTTLGNDHTGRLSLAFAA